MKANEAPEKIYIEVTTDGTRYYRDVVKEQRTENSDIEYTLTDAFIEKAASWLKEHREAVETEDNGIMGWIPDYFIEDFRNYMKGEEV